MITLSTTGKEITKYPNIQNCYIMETNHWKIYNANQFLPATLALANEMNEIHFLPWKGHVICYISSVKADETSNSRITLHHYCFLILSLILWILHNKFFKPGRIICHYSSSTQLKCFSEFFFIIQHPQICLGKKTHGIIILKINKKIMSTMWYLPHIH